MKQFIAAPLSALVLLAGCATTPKDGSVDLIDKKLSQWDIFMGAPHTTTEIEGYPKFDNVTKGTPIGLNKDPKQVFSVIKEDGEKVLRISGEIFAGLVTKEEYADYHLSWQFKWGDKKWEPRLNKKRNSGVLYHSVGDYTDFWNVWMTSLECEVQQTDCGDYISIGAVKASLPCSWDGKRYVYDPDGKWQEFAWGHGCKDGRCYKPAPDPELPHGQWNTMEIYAFADKAVHIVNGKVVMILKNPLQKRSGDEWIPMTKGKIQLQSESAEIFYKNIIIRPITELPPNLNGLFQHN